MDINENLDTARVALNNAILLIKESPDKTACSDLINACESIDARYKEFCEEFDGDAYEDGISIEFYCEAEDWHRVSLALRKLRADV